MPSQTKDRLKEKDQPDLNGKKVGSTGMEKKFEEELRFKFAFAPVNRGGSKTHSRR